MVKSKEPRRNVYVGHRYVPKIFGEWDKQNEYEGLSIVTYQGASYTSKKRVPVGIDILNEEYWTVTGNYNAQIEYYRDEVRNVVESLKDKADKEELELFIKQIDNDFKQFEIDMKKLMNELNDEVDEKIDKITTFVTPHMYGAKSDGITDDSSAFQNALNYLNNLGGGVLNIPTGRYYINSVIDVPSNVEIVGNGKNTVIVTNNIYNVFRITGSYDEYKILTSVVSRGSNNLPVDNTTGLKVNDYVKIIGQRQATSKDDNSEGWVIGKTTGTNDRLYHGEYGKIKGVSEKNIILDSGVLFPSYRPNNQQESDPRARLSTQVRKVNFKENIFIGNFKIEGKAQLFVLCQTGRNVTVKDITWENMGISTLMSMRESLDCKAENNHLVYNKSVSHSNNAIDMWSSTLCGAVNNTVMSHPRTAFDSSYTTLNNEGIVGIYNYFQDNSTLFCEKSLTIHGGNMSVNIQNNKFMNNDLQGIETRARDTIITDNVITGSYSESQQSYGINLYDGYAHDCIISGNIIRRMFYGISIRSSDESPFNKIGAVISGNRLSSINTGIGFLDHAKSITDCECNVLITDNIIENHYGNSLGKAIRIDSNYHEITITNNSFRGNSFTNGGIFGAKNVHNIFINGNSFKGFGEYSVWFMGMADNHDHSRKALNGINGYFMQLGSDNRFDVMPRDSFMSALDRGRSIVHPSQVPFKDDTVWIGTNGYNYSNAFIGRVLNDIPDN